MFEWMKLSSEFKNEFSELWSQLGEFLKTFLWNCLLFVGHHWTEILKVLVPFVIFKGWLMLTGHRFLTTAKYFRYGEVKGYLRPVDRAVLYIDVRLKAIWDLIWLQTMILLRKGRRINRQDVQRFAEFYLLQPPPDQTKSGATKIKAAYYVSQLRSLLPKFTQQAKRDAKKHLDQLHESVSRLPQGKTDMQAWKDQQANVVIEGNAYQFDTCFDLHRVFTETQALRDYAKWIMAEYPVPIPGEIQSPGRFSGSLACRVTIKEGFVAPLYLLSGLLSEFDDQWPPIVSKYGATRASNADDVTNVQLYQLFCWLIWGPSVPLCMERTCGRSMGTHWGDRGKALLQYGYGDESNSILLQSANQKVFKALIDTMPAPPLAQRISVTGRIYYKDLLVDQEEEDYWTPSHQMMLDDIPSEVRCGGGANIIINVENETDISPGIQKTHSRMGTYYGAYLWVMFAICDSEARSADGSEGFYEDTWRNLLPFFVHGNVAEEKSYEHVSHLVAVAAASGARQILRANANMKLKYISAIDDSNCGNDLLQGETDRNNGRRSILDFLRKIKDLYPADLKNLLLPASRHDKSYERPQLELNGQIVAMDGCNLPLAIHEFLSGLDGEAPEVEATPEVESPAISSALVAESVRTTTAAKPHVRHAASVDGRSKSADARLTGAQRR